MDTKTVIELVEELQENIEDLEDNLEPILTGSLPTTSRKLPLLDRAKLNVVLVYSIESLLFSYLKLHGVQAKEHPVFKELTRVKQYFEKVKAVEAGPDSAKPTVILNKDAAGRFIKHALAGNEKYDLERAQREAREKLLANKKLKDLESAMKGRSVKNSSIDEDSNASNALARAAQLASVPMRQRVDDASPSDTSQGKKRKNGPKAQSRRAKRKRETGFHDIKNKEQMEKALARQARRKAAKEAEKAEQTATAAA